MIHLVTGEYPPMQGGVGDYTALIAARAAAEGHAVHVWTRGNEGTSCEEGVITHRIAGAFSPSDLTRLDRDLSSVPGPRRLLVQWTPPSFGFRSLNLFVPAWIWKRAKHNGDRIEIMVHEPFLAFKAGGWRHNVAAAVQRLMIAALLSAACRVWIAIPEWESRLKPWCFGRPREFTWLPVPSNIGDSCDAYATFTIRCQLTRQHLPLVGHFGTYRTDVAALLEAALHCLLEASNAIVLLAGFGSAEFAMCFTPLHPGRVVATGNLDKRSIAEHLSACDVLLQPYPDGISTRRGSAMAALALGVPAVTNLGHLSEPFWLRSGAIQIARSKAPRDLAECALKLIADRDLRMATSEIARQLYRDRFAVDRTTGALLRDYPPDFENVAGAVA